MATTNPKHINEIYPNHAIVLEASDLSPLILPTFLGIWIEEQGKQKYQLEHKTGLEDNTPKLETQYLFLHLIFKIFLYTSSPNDKPYN